MNLRLYLARLLAGKEYEIRILHRCQKVTFVSDAATTWTISGNRFGCDCS